MRMNVAHPDVKDWVQFSSLYRFSSFPVKFSEGVLMVQVQQPCKSLNQSRHHGPQTKTKLTNLIKYPSQSTFRQTESEMLSSWKTSHCSFYLPWPLAAVVRSRPSHASSLRLHCFSFCLWRGDVLRRDGKGFLAVFPSPRLDGAAAVCGPDPPVLGGQGAGARWREQHRRGLTVRRPGSAPLSGWLAH